ncbi:nitrite reductase small subunit NirD [Shewanella cyperi]|uniref:nitrite reductase small subunit NirD n=1 Tax=Shewanella cyperi TaxID=2814292 RepID=UPI001A9501AB|nr:nitrite reductase small subunit NirD [Shewanella cyperi]QSX42159.1 nitrite reductase small subunit NirD [Shewanella cyperi]
MNWTQVCEKEALPEGAGVAAWLGSRPVAIFNLGHRGLYALDNRCPATGVSLLARGQVCELAGELYVCSPLYKQHFHLTTGECLEDTELNAIPIVVKADAAGVWLAGEGA